MKHFSEISHNLAKFHKDFAIYEVRIAQNFIRILRYMKYEFRKISQNFIKFHEKNLVKIPTQGPV